MKAPEFERFDVATLIEAKALLVEDGNHGEYRPRPDEFTNVGGTPFIRAADVLNGRVGIDTAERINDVALARIRKGVGRPGDVILTHKGTVGRIGIVATSDHRPFVCSPQTTFWRVLDDGVIDRNYLVAYMRSPGFKRQLDRVMGETDMAPYVSLTAQRAFAIHLPVLPVQRAIGSVIVALDRRVALCQAQASTLEGLAQAVFEAMTAEYDWPRGALSDLGVPINDKVTSDPPAIITLDQMPKRSTVLSEWREFGGEKSLRLFKTGDVLFGKLRPYFHKVGVAPVDGACSTEILVLRPHDNAYWGFLLAHAASDAFIEHCVQHSTGTRMPRAEWKDVKGYEIAMPPLDVAQQYADTIRPLYERIRLLVHQARTLAELRDALLPKLVSGELEVPESLLEAYGDEPAVAGS